MQIFVVESSPAKVAQALCDRHVITQTTDVAQLLALAHLHNGEQVPPLQTILPNLSKLNYSYPKWVGATIGNYQWTEELARALLDEYHYRYKHPHPVSIDIIRMKYPPFKLMKENKTITPAPAPIPKRLVDRKSITNSYRNYYRYKAQTVPMNWTNRHPPVWFM